MEEGIKDYTIQNPIHRTNLETFLKLLKYKKVKEIIMKEKSELMKKMFYDINANLSLIDSPLKVEPYSHLCKFFLTQPLPSETPSSVTTSRWKENSFAKI